jgi:hypothetical protein
MRLADFDVRIEPPGLGAVGLLLGQVLPRRPRAQDPLGGNAWLFERGRRPRWAAFGGSGEFALPLPRGRRWTLWVEWGALRARLESP